MVISVTQAVRRAVVLSGPCFYCGDKAKHADHIDATINGGKEAAENLVPACAKCNCEKSDKVLGEEDRLEALTQAWINVPKVEKIAESLLAKNIPENKLSKELYNYIYGKPK